MTFGKASALVVGFLGAVALGMWIGLHVTNWTAPQDRIITAETPATPVPEVTAPPVTKPTMTRAARAKAAPATTDVKAAAVEPSAPELQERLKPVLNRGANLTLASEGFRNGEQFAMVAHAARNTQIPFMVLKDRVVNQGKTLDAAIREWKPEMDAKAEASRARAEAREDIVQIQS